VRNIYVVDITKSKSSTAKRKPEIDVIGKAQTHDTGALLPEHKGKSAIGDGIQINFEEIDVKFAIDVMELVLVALGFG